MKKNIFRLCSFILLGFFFQIYPDSFVLIPREKISSFNQFMKSQGKIYYCDQCPEQAASILIPLEWSFQPIPTGASVEYKLVINKTDEIEPTKIYISEGEKWINLGKKLSIQSSLPEILPESLYPEDPEVLAWKEISIPSEIPYMNMLEKKIWDDLNLIRTNPEVFADKIQKLIPFIKGNSMFLPNRKPYRLHADKKGFESLVERLKNLEKVSPLLSEEKLNNGVRANRLVDSSDLWKNYEGFIDRPQYLYIYELTQSGLFRSDEILANLLSHRWQEFSETITDSDFSYAGVACGIEKKTVSCKILFTSALEPPSYLQKFLLDLETKSDQTYLTLFEKAIIEETNFLRTNPQKYVEFLKERRPYYKKGFYKVPKLAPVNRTEGLKALEEAIRVMEKTQPLNELKMSEPLSMSSKDHVVDTGKIGMKGHYGSDGSSPVTRIARYKKDYQAAGENIAYGFFSPRDVVIELFIDDGVLDRGHRKNLLNSQFENIGVNCGYHKTYRVMCVQNFATWK